MPKTVGVRNILTALLYLYNNEVCRATRCLFVFGATGLPQWARASSFTRFLDHNTTTHHSR